MSKTGRTMSSEKVIGDLENESELLGQRYNDHRNFIG